ncbi:diguanylate cyclase [Anaerobacillus sp. HL2]|nr:diguanylate cyclase [Anaerobacillus sp. HL2]
MKVHFSKQADIHLNISIGISVYPANAETTEDLVKNADIALFALQKVKVETCICFIRMT